MPVADVSMRTFFRVHHTQKTAAGPRGGSAFAAGDADKGKAAFAAAWGICHEVGPGAKTLVGPELNGIVGRKAASYAD